eukprot:scaffold4966_cov135-Skeletonema_marinoi.AAC.1
MFDMLAMSLSTLSGGATVSEQHGACFVKCFHEHENYVIVRDSTNAEEEHPWLLQLKEEGKDVSIMIFISRSGMQEDLGKTCRGKEARSRATSPDRLGMKAVSMEQCDVLGRFGFGSENLHVTGRNS